jgi:hypothetical protein
MCYRITQGQALECFQVHRLNDYRIIGADAALHRRVPYLYHC